MTTLPTMLVGFLKGFLIVDCATGRLSNKVPNFTGHREFVLRFQDPWGRDGSILILFAPFLKARQNGTNNRFFKLNVSTILAKADEKTRSKICPSELLTRMLLCIEFYCSKFRQYFVHPIMINLMHSEYPMFVLISIIFVFGRPVATVEIVELLKISYVWMAFLPLIRNRCCTRKIQALNRHAAL